jgi:hypothetical protein
LQNQRDESKFSDYRCPGEVFVFRKRLAMTSSGWLGLCQIPVPGTPQHAFSAGGYQRNTCLNEYVRSSNGDRVLQPALFARFKVCRSCFIKSGLQKAIFMPDAGCRSAVSACHGITYADSCGPFARYRKRTKVRPFDVGPKGPRSGHASIPQGERCGNAWSTYWYRP